MSPTSTVSSHEQAHPERWRSAISNPLLSSVIVFCAFLVFFLHFRSNNYMAVDGPLRCLGVFHKQTYFFHGNNHLLYPFWIFCWSRLSEMAGISVADPFAFIRVSQAMNSFAAAASITILYLLMSPVAGQRAALLGTLLLGFSTAMLLHATNSAEALPGFFFSMLAIGVFALGLRRASLTMFVVTGVSLALALASYQAMGIAAVIVAFLCVCWPAAGGLGPRNLASVVQRLGLVAIGGILGVCVVYGYAYAAQGVSIQDMPKHFLSLGESSEIYGGLKLSRIVNLPFGLVRNLYNGVPSDYVGVRSLLVDERRTIWIFAALAGLALLAAIAYIAAAEWRMIARRFSRGWLALGLVPCAALAFPLLYWDPMYDKLWLLPLAAGIFLLTLGLRACAAKTLARLILWTLTTLLLIVEAGMNLPQVFAHHATGTPHLEDARRLAALIRPDDWVVLGFDDASQLWLSIWGYESNYLMLPSSREPEELRWLSDAKQASRKGKARILFVGVLDQDRTTWDAFLGRRVGIPFESLDEYRTEAVILDTFDFAGHRVTVREFSDGQSDKNAFNTRKI